MKFKNNIIHSFTFLIFMFFVNENYAQTNLFKNTDNKNVFYKFEKKDSTFLLIIPYKVNPINPIISGMNLEIDIDNYNPISINEISYNTKDSAFIINISKNNILHIINSKKTTIYTTIHELGETDTYIKGLYENCTIPKK